MSKNISKPAKSPLNGNRIRVLATGVFDLLHPGHIHYLESSKKLGDELIVLVTNDDYVRQTKGEPVFPAASRRHLIEALACVDEVIIPTETQPDQFYKTVLAIEPDIITLGFNQKFSGNDLKAEFARHGWQGDIVRIGPYKEAGLSSTQLKDKIRHS